MRLRRLLKLLRIEIGKVFGALFFLFFFLPSASTFAAGYEILEQSATGMGQAFAGTTTGLKDGSELFYNPAAMTALNQSVLSVHGSIISPSSDFRDRGSSLIPALGGAGLTGGDGGNPGEVAVVPNIYFTAPLSDSFSAGIGVNSPFGLSTSYDTGWVGRYHALESELTTVNINPAVAYQASSKISFGAGLRVIHADATLTNAVDFGSIGVASLGLPTATALGLSPQANDGYARVRGSDWGVGYQVGMLATPAPQWRIGVSYRSKVDLTLDGSARFDVPSEAQPLTLTGSFVNTTARAGATLPEMLALGVAHDIIDRLSVYGDFNWTRWSRFEELRVSYGSPQADTVQDENWDNSVKVALGGSYAATEALTVRAGLAWDETPIPDSQHRTPRIPDSDRLWLATGISYTLTSDLELILSYAHIFADDGATELTNQTGATLLGSYENSSVNLVSAALVASF